MTFYSVLLFAHIASAFLLFAGLALEWALISFLRRNPDLAPYRAWGRLFSVAPPLYGPAIGVILLSGGYLGAQMRAWDQGWIRISFAALVFIGLISVTLTAPRARAIRKLLAAASDSTLHLLRARLQDPVLLASVRIRVALVFGVLLLMVSKVDLGPSLTVIACATALGVAVALPAWRHMPGAHSTN
jgi:Predicted integral membrane protein (DUF2269)